MTKDKQRTANSHIEIGGVPGFADIEAQNLGFVLLKKFGAAKPRLRQPKMFSGNLMKAIIWMLAILAFSSCNNSKNKIDMEYQNKFSEAKKTYPFDQWRASYDDGLEQYTQENCDKARKIFDDLIDGLVAIGQDASEEKKVALFEKAILATNELNSECEDSLIETGEREELCELTDKIAIACGLNPEKYGDGEGLASEWREW